MRRWMTVMILTCAVALLAMRYFNDQSAKLENLARSGAIESDAPVKASLDVVIDAPVGKVWGILTDVDRWPRWETDIKDAEIAGPVAIGTTFKWTMGAAHIHSTIALAEPEERIAWTGTALNARAVHVWKLERLGGNRTRVSMEESMSGILLGLLYSSKELEASDRRWLDRLKHQAER